MKAVSLEKLLPADVPEGEQILWHGRPQWVSLARRAYRADFIAAYFVALTVWSVWSAAELGWSAAALAGVKTLGLGAAALAIIAGLAFLSARTTLYVVTSRRLVLKVGIALPIFINVPFKDIGSASARVYRRRNGRHSARAREGQADRLLDSVAERPSVPSSQAAALPAIRRRRRRRRRDRRGGPSGRLRPGAGGGRGGSRSEGRASRRGADAWRTGCGLRGGDDDRSRRQTTDEGNAEGGADLRRRSDRDRDRRRLDGAAFRIRTLSAARGRGGAEPLPALRGSAGRFGSGASAQTTAQ